MKIQQFNPNKNLYLYIFPILIFIPKIDIINIPGYWQGIRFEDIFLSFYFLSFFALNNKKEIINKNFEFKPGLILFGYLILSNWIAITNGSEVKIIMVIRLFEYIVLLYFIHNLKINKEDIYKLIVYYVFANFIITTLQDNGLLGAISSKGYVDNSAIRSQAVPGLSGGTWELGILLTLSFFIIMKYTKNEIRDYFLFAPIIFYQIILTDSFTSLIATGFIFLLYFPNIFKKLIRKLDPRQKLIIIFFIILFHIIVFYFIGNFYERTIFTITQFDYYNFTEILKKFIFYLEIPVLQELDVSLYSLYHRLESWQIMFKIFFSDYFNILFGTGFTKFLYLDSTYVRIITSFGLLGTFLILFFVINLNFYLLLYLIIISFSFDLFISFKIFLFFLILMKNFKENKVDTKS